MDMSSVVTLYVAVSVFALEEKLGGERLSLFPA
jgi:hypothetical protein